MTTSSSGDKRGNLRAPRTRTSRAGFASAVSRALRAGDFIVRYAADRHRKEGIFVSSSTSGRASVHLDFNHYDKRHDELAAAIAEHLSGGPYGYTVEDNRDAEARILYVTRAERAAAPTVYRAWLRLVIPDGDRLTATTAATTPCTHKHPTWQLAAACGQETVRALCAEAARTPFLGAAAGVDVRSEATNGDWIDLERWLRYGGTTD